MNKKQCHNRLKWFIEITLTGAAHATTSAFLPYRSPSNNSMMIRRMKVLCGTVAVVVLASTAVLAKGQNNVEITEAHPNRVVIYVDDLGLGDLGCDGATAVETEQIAPKTVSRYLVGANLVYSKEDGRSWETPNKVDILKRAGMSNLRYPGGHVVSYWDWEFPYHSAYTNFWEPGYIDRLTESKKSQLKAAAKKRLSLDQYLKICREIGAVPLIGINLFQGYRYDRKEDSVAKAVRLVNYVKDKISGPRYYYLDNEVGHQPEQNNHIPIDAYLPLIPDYATAIKEADPQGKIAVNIMRWRRVEEIVRDYGDYVDLYDQHKYYNNGPWGRFSLDEWRADVDMGGYATRLTEFNNWIARYKKPHLKISFLEWNIGPATGGDDSPTRATVFYQGLVQADMLMHMIRFDVYMASVWPLTWNNSFTNLMDATGRNVSPTLYIHRAFSKAAGGRVLSLSVHDKGGLLRSLAVKSADEDFIDLYFLNKSKEASKLEIVLPDPIIETLQMNYVQGASPEEVNVSEQQHAGGGITLQLSLGDTSFMHVRCTLGKSRDR